MIFRNQFILSIQCTVWQLWSYNKYVKIRGLYIKLYINTKLINNNEMTRIHGNEKLIDAKRWRYGRPSLDISVV